MLVAARFFARQAVRRPLRFQSRPLWKPRPRAIALQASGATLTALSLLQLAGPEGKDTHEDRMLAASQAELKAPSQVWGRTILAKLYDWIYEPLCTALRFLQLVAIFGPVIVASPLLYYPKHYGLWYELLVRAMEMAGPAFIKLGQWAASRSDLFPAELCDIMSRLHSEAPAHSFSHTRREIAAAFGMPLEEIFAEFDKEPLGVGAIAQVYRARLHPRWTSDEPQPYAPTLRDSVESLLKTSPRPQPSAYVAVKILHPHVERTVRRDLRIMGVFARAINAIPTAEWLSVPDEVEQFGIMMRLQLDLRIEAANLVRFRANFADRSTVAFPAPFLELTTRHVLVEQFARGVPLAKFLDLGAGVFRKDVAREGLDAFLRMLLLDNFAHADLHPGNIMVRFSHSDPKAVGDATELALARLNPISDQPSWLQALTELDTDGFRPQLVFIDTGLVTELNATNRENFLDLFRSVAEFDGFRAGQLMCERCRTPEAVLEPHVFALKMQDLVLRVKATTLALASVGIGDILSQVFSMVRDHHVRMEGDFVNVVLSIMLLECLGRQMDPDLDLLSSSLPILRQLGGRAEGRADVPLMLVWLGLETRRFLQASVDDVERCVKYDLLSPNV